MTNKIAVVGSRGYNNYPQFKERLEFYIQNLEDVVFVSGGCPSGADAMIKRWCHENDRELKEHLPDWENGGKKAGILRNTNIIEDADYLIAYYNGTSKGTLDSIKKAEKKGIPIKIIKI